MKNIGLVILYILICLVILYILISGCSDADFKQFTEVPETVYRFEKFDLPDGTPCHHVKVSGHSAKSGVTCNYGSAK